MKETRKIYFTMNVVILTAFIWYFIDPEINYLITKIHLTVASIFVAYKILKK